MQGHRAFICHASEDRERANRVVEHLEATGISCWIAPRDVPSGQRYAAALLQAIHATEVFVILFSEHADRSPHVPNEIEKGASANKPILLIRTDETDPHRNDQISLFVGSHQWLDASASELDDHLEQIAVDVEQMLRNVPDDGDRTPPETQPPPTPKRALPRRCEEPALGVEVGVTKVRGCVVDLADIDAELPPERHYIEKVAAPATIRNTLEVTKAMVERMLDDHCADNRPLGIGVAVPGQVDLRVGTLKFGPNLFGARNVPFKTYLSRALPGVEVRVDNEVRCATRFELHQGSGRDFEDFACMFIGTGVGSGTVVNRKVYFGHNFCAGEVGHVKIAATGPPCACGQIGCLETFVKAQAIVSRAEAKAIDWRSRELDTVLAGRERALQPEDVAEAIDDGDEAAREVAKEVAADLGLGIANYLNLMNPAAVIIGGGLMTGFFFHMIQEVTGAVQSNALAEVANTPIVQSAHSEESIARGAALLFHPEDGWPF